MLALFMRGKTEAFSLLFQQDVFILPLVTAENKKCQNKNVTFVRSV